LFTGAGRTKLDPVGGGVGRFGEGEKGTKRDKGAKTTTEGGDLLHPLQQEREGKTKGGEGKRGLDSASVKNKPWENPQGKRDTCAGGVTQK